MRLPALALSALLTLTMPAWSASTPWVGSWRAAAQPSMGDEPLRLHDQTLRLVLSPTLAGRVVRIKLSNRYGREPVVIGGAQLASHAGDGRLGAGSRASLSFGGQAGLTLAPGAEAWSDPLRWPVAAGEALAVDLYLPAAAELRTVHELAQQTSYLLPGDARGREQPGPRVEISTWPLLTGLDVQPDGAATALLLLGDSQIDGDGSRENGNDRLGDQLARLLRGEGHAVGVLNEGLIGNRLLRGSPGGPQNPAGAGFGEAGLTRAAAAVDNASGAKTVLLHLGTNDLGLAGSLAPADEAVDAEALIAGQQRLAAQMKARGLCVVASTLAPFNGVTVLPGYAAPAKDVERQRFNRWLRAHAAEFDGLLDFDAVLRDPRRPRRLRPAFDSGDHLHPNAAGYAALARAFPRACLTSSATRAPS